MGRIAACLLAGLFLIAGCSGDSPSDSSEPDDSTPALSDSTPAPEAETPSEAQPTVEVLAKIKLELGSELDVFSFAVDPKGAVFLPNVTKNRVEVFSPAGKLVNSWGETGSDHGEFDFHEDTGEAGPENVGGLDIDGNGSVYVTESVNMRVQKFDQNGKLLLSWGGEGLKNGQFIRPLDVAVADDGSVYVVDDRSTPYRIQKFNPNGRFIDKFGMLDLVNPGAIEIGPDGSLYVANFDGHNVLKYSQQGKLLDTFDGGGLTLGQPADIAIASDGTMYVVDADKLNVAVLDPKGEGLYTLDEPNFAQPVGVTLDAHENLYVADDRARTIYKLRVTPP